MPDHASSHAAPTPPPLLILGSSSRYRRDLLQRLGLPFTTHAPNVDERPRTGEAPRDTALRLSALKASAVRASHPQAVVIASDQVADCDGQAINKPGNYQAAFHQLQRLQGRQVRFHTGLCVQRGDHQALDCVTTTVQFLPLTDTQIRNYLQREPAFDCAGSAKVEGLGISLLASVQDDDPTALIGLPLIRLTAMLREFGIDPLA